jgi:hypothetical protein
MTNIFEINGFIKAAFITLIILGGMVTYGTSNSSPNGTVNEDTQNSMVIENIADSHVHDIASCVVDILLVRIAKDATFRSYNQVSERLYGGEAAYTVKDTFFESENLIEIQVIAKYKDVKNIITYNIYKETKRKKSINIKFEYE